MVRLGISNLALVTKWPRARVYPTDVDAQRFSEVDVTGQGNIGERPRCEPADDRAADGVACYGSGHASAEDTGVIEVTQTQTCPKVEVTKIPVVQPVNRNVESEFLGQLVEQVDKRSAVVDNDLVGICLRDRITLEGGVKFRVACGIAHLHQHLLEHSLWSNARGVVSVVEDAEEVLPVSLPRIEQCVTTIGQGVLGQVRLSDEAVGVVACVYAGGGVAVVYGGVGSFAHTGIYTRRVSTNYDAFGAPQVPRVRVRSSVGSVTSDNDAVFGPVHLLVEVAFLTVEVVRDDEGVVNHTIGKF